jgi:tetratricopeptide (TPR) repeat protein
MKRMALFVSVLAVLAMLVVLRNRGPAPVDTKTASESADQEHRAATVAFWQHYRSAMKSRRAGEWSAAIEQFRRALELDPKHEDSLYYMGNALFESGEFEDAERSWQQLLEANSMASRAHAQLGQLRSCPDVESLFDLEAARLSFEQALALNQEESGPLSRLGEVELALGNVARAAKLLEDARRSNPRSASAHYLGAYIAMRKGEPANAAALLSAARSAVTVKRATELPVLEGDIRLGDSEKLVGETMSGRRLFAPLLEQLRGRESVDAATEADAVDAYLRAIPHAGGS